MHFSQVLSLVHVSDTYIGNYYFTIIIEATSKISIVVGA